MRALARVRLASRALSPRRRAQLQFFGFTVSGLVSAAPEVPAEAHIDGIALDATRLPGVLLSLFHAALFVALFATRSALWTLGGEQRLPVARDVGVAAAQEQRSSLTTPLLRDDAEERTNGGTDAAALQQAQRPRELACPDDAAAVARSSARRAEMLSLCLIATNLLLRFTLAVLETLGALCSCACAAHAQARIVACCC
jgi:hypothetical protein